MHTSNILIGLGAYLIIELLHPVVIKTEYHVGIKAWPVFLITGLLSLAGSLFVVQAVLGPLLSVLGFSLLWSIKELKEQEKRVEKGWFPKNPNRS